jgi:aspartyl-tRNA(Asn)/glutamyl-tRNA(Gln) amidotransferase subunit A
MVSFARVLSEGSLTLTVAAELLRRKEITSVELVRAVLSRADVCDPELGTYVSRFDDAALAAAEQADADFVAGSTGGRSRASPSGSRTS